MTRCDHCRRVLGARVHRYWQMRFCSEACADAYRQRLADATQAKIRLLDRADQPLTEKFGWSKYGWPKHNWPRHNWQWRSGLRRHLPGSLAR